MSSESFRILDTPGQRSTGEFTADLDALRVALGAETPQSGSLDDVRDQVTSAYDDMDFEAAPVPVAPERQERERVPTPYEVGLMIARVRNAELVGSLNGELDTVISPFDTPDKDDFSLAA